MTLVLRNVQIFDPEVGELSSDSWIIFADGKVVDRGAGDPPASLPETSTVVDGDGATVLPGFIDAHVHLTVSSLNFGDMSTWTAGYAYARAAKQAERMLRRGFTTVRDVGGADFGFVRGAREGLFPSPRIFFGGNMISQSGGHGDHRPITQDPSCKCETLSISTIADGVDEVIRAVRGELRKGADHIKLTASGGVASPHDEIDAVQFTAPEIHAAVVEAENANRYVTVHAYHPRAIRQAVEAGVHCVEHGNLLDDETIALMASRGTHLVPTLVTYELLHSQGEAAGLAPESIAKVREVRENGLTAYAKAHAAGVPISFGTDLLAEMEFAQLNEFAIRAQVTSPLAVIREATVNAAKLLRREGELGSLRVGAVADAVVYRHNPLENIAVLTNPDAELAHIVQGGQLVS